MAYTKLQTTCPDHAIGVASINALQENQASLLSELSAEHGFDDGVQSGSTSLGVHNSIRISRDTVRVSVLTLGPSRIALLDSSAGNVRSATSPAVGRYEVACSGLWTIVPGANPLSSSGTRMCVASAPFDAATSDRVVYVACYELSGGDFVLSDFPFSLTMFGA